jgi:2-polyprenyl-6-methoxyphenol hydroxylase-like FAD-dependent oxidoreductase
MGAGTPTRAKMRASMLILIVGAGPAGLYLAYLLHRHRPDDRIRIVEQNPPDSTFGFGVVFSDRALEFLRDDDPETSDLLTPAMERWADLTVTHREERITIDGVGFAAIGRLALLQRLGRRLDVVGITPEYRHLVSEERELESFDLVVAADGANSFVRRGLERRLGTSSTLMSNRFVWYGTTRRFETLSQTFVTDEAGAFNAHHYRYEPGMSTFIVETDAATWARAGFAPAWTRPGRGPTASGCSRGSWADIPWSPTGRSGASSPGSPTRAGRPATGSWPATRPTPRTSPSALARGLAFEDAIALARALRDQPGDLPAALQAYEAARRPIVDKIVAAADASAGWYERFADHMALPPWDLAWSYIQRSGRVDVDRLAQVSPRFVAGYRARAAVGPSC